MKQNINWQARLHASKSHTVKPAPINIAGMKKGQIMLVPSAQMVDFSIRLIPYGRKLSIQELRAELANQHGAEVTCPITTGFHLRTVAEVAYEDFLATRNVEEITPIWRVLDKHAPTIKRLSYDPRFIFLQQEKEFSHKDVLTKKETELIR